ncbi:chemotaxis protein CheD [Sporosarcina sp. HYO08]|uniref:chemotaxis protein CheD n=1 Tax=Sporosarcina sp. HYO08 TaxID=1759557 RepID=UPI000797E3AF|nr:chemotaxis protein CheD [Sporosarcina sp. HYO08]KXH80004.1 chemotaxis protein CheD [Sporosarcina sp. HYO08]
MDVFIKEVVRVGIADMNVVGPGGTIRTIGLGSCVGVVLYDEMKRIAGLLHVMLPNSELAKSTDFNKAKFANTGVPALIDALEAKGARTSALRAKIAGGAQMFQLGSNESFRIGHRNIEAVKEELKRCRIPLIAEDTGGTNGRTIEFDTETSILHVRTVNKGNQEL